MLTEDFDYDLPEELIAKYPREKRDEAGLLVLHRGSGSMEHRRFYDIADYLNEGDCLVMNDSRVLPARLCGHKAGTGASAEALLTKDMGEDTWEALVRPGKRLKPGACVVFSDEPGKRLSAEVTGFGNDGTRHLKFSYDGAFYDRLREFGKMPLPPYINRAAEQADYDTYQTVYSREEGSVASPTAGLHFTDELLEKIRRKGVDTAFLTLHVGIGTFRPVKCDVIEEHKMHTEHYEITEEAAGIINSARRRGGRIVAVGTTSVRTLESASGEDGILLPGTGDTDIFIYPGYKFKMTDSIITNFHLPRSTLLMLVSAFYNRAAVLEAYREAVRMKYRFFSYGDAMFII